MAFSINTAFIVGNVASDVTIKFTGGGTAVCNFSVATNRSIKKDDKWQDVPTFHRIVVWGKLAEAVGNNLTKGRKVTIQGRIDNRSYNDKDGDKKYISEIVADSVIFEKGSANTHQGESDDYPPSDPDSSGAEDIAEDIPF